MKKKITLILTAAAISITAVTGCSQSSGGAAETSTAAESESETEASEAEAAAGEADSTKEAESSEQWIKSDKQGVLEATGFELTAPEGAEEVEYAYLEADKTAQMTYTLDDKNWTYRMKSADKLEDISGRDQEWLDAACANNGNDFVSGREANNYSYVGAEGENDIQIVDWYDAVTGTVYSLTAEGEDLDGMDIQVYAENLYEPLQGEATDDAAADRENELNDYFLGERKSSYDDSTLKISDNNDGTFRVDISITRLCDLENGTGTFDDHKMYFVAEDPNGGEISGMIYRDNDNSLTIKITDSSWELINVGDTFESFEK